ncbi:MAG TPA: hypothetical protein VK766_09310, partial [Cytophagaceae bacterium]|nr:hypothetical protein [Cytophagaceae bacterium]
GEKVGKNRTTVNNYLRLLKLPPDIQAALRDDEISMGHARALINIENTEDQLSIFRKVEKEDLSVRKVEELVRELGKGKEKKEVAAKETVAKNINAELQQLQSKLSSHFGTKVAVKGDEGNKGEIKIPFVSVEDLNRILDILNVHL